MEPDLDVLRALVGAEHVQAASQLAGDRQDTAPFTRLPIAYVSPGSLQQLQDIFKWAHETGVKVWVNGQGRNWGYGATVPRSHGALVVLLRRMNRIVHVDDELAYAVIEPGVTYRQLADYLEERHPGLWIDCIDGTPSGSVLGNALERGVGPTPYGDHYGHLCGLEVLLPTGAVIQTGGMKDSATFHTYRWGAGPVIDGLFSQSNFGVVVQAGIWLMPKPQHFESFLFESHEHVDFDALIRALQPMFLEGVLRGAIRMINDMVGISLFAQYPNGPNQCMTQPEIDELRRNLGLARWSMSAGLYGTRESVRAQKQLLRRSLRGYGRIEFMTPGRIALLESYVGFAKRFRPQSVGFRLLERPLRTFFGKPLDVVAAVPHMHGLMQGRPTEYFVRHAYFKMHARPESDINPARDGCGVVWFAPIVPNRVVDLQAVLALGREAYAAAGFEFHVALIFQNARSVIVLMSIFYFRDDADERRRAEALTLALAQRCREARYQEYRTGVSHMDGLYADDQVYAALLAGLKQAIDPQAVLAPGRYGVGQPG